MPAIKCPVPGCSFATQEDAGDVAAAALLRIHVDKNHPQNIPTTHSLKNPSQTHPSAQTPQTGPSPFTSQQVHFGGFAPQFYGVNRQQSAGQIYGVNPQQSTGQIYGVNPQQSAGHIYGVNPQQSAGHIYGVNPQQSAGQIYAVNPQQPAGQIYGYSTQVPAPGQGPQFVPTHAYGPPQPGHPHSKSSQVYGNASQADPQLHHRSQQQPRHGPPLQHHPYHGAQPQHGYYQQGPPPHSEPLCPSGAYASPSTNVSFTGCVINNATNVISQNNYTVTNSNLKHFGPVKIENTYIDKVNIHKTNIEKVTAEFGAKEEEAEDFLNLLGDENEREGNLQKLVNLKKENKMKLPTVSKMTRSTCLVRRVGPEPHGATAWGTKWHGTGFLATLPIQAFKGAVLFSAGHNFEHGGELLQDFENFSFIFNNSCGVVDPSKPAVDEDEKNIIIKTMKEFMREFTCTVFISYKGKRLIKKPNEAATISQHSNTELDYFALILNDEKSQENLREQNLELLETGSEAEMKNCSGDPVFILGHPGLSACPCCRGKCCCFAANPPCQCRPPCHHPACSCRHPLRFSYGVTKKEKIKNNIHYKMDTEGGNSGSPITGKQYTVLGIHVSDTLGDHNRAQSLHAVLKDLARGDAENLENSDNSDLTLQSILNQLKNKLKI